MSRTAIATAAVLAAVFLALALGAEASARVSGWDLAATEWFVSMRTDGATLVFWLLTVLGDGWVVAALVAVSAGVLALWDRVRAALLLAVSVAAGQLIVEAVKALAERTRPPGAVALIATPESFSFPSGHSFTGLVFAGLLAVILAAPLVSRAARGAVVAAGAVAGLSIGLSRAYLGVHWLSDVVASWALGAAWLVLSVAVGVRIGALDERAAPVTVPRLAITALLAAVGVAAVALGALAEPISLP